MASVPTFSGDGSLYEGETELGDVSYSVHLARPSLPGGLTRISGEIIDTVIDLFALFARKEPPQLTLHMEDGVRWDCGLASVDGRLHPVGKRLYRLVDGRREELH
jgi:hypothetical protein